MTVLLIDPEGIQLGHFTLEKAQMIAENEYHLDLVLVQDGVYKILDKGKLLYKASKMKKQKTKPVKEMKFRLNIAQADFETKIRGILRFLDAGNTVKVTIWFTGREVSRPDTGVLLLKRVQEAVLEWGTMVIEPGLDGKNMYAQITPRKKQT